MRCEVCGRKGIALPRCATCQRDFTPLSFMFGRTRPRDTAERQPALNPLSVNGSMAPSNSPAEGCHVRLLSDAGFAPPLGAAFPGLSLASEPQIRSGGYEVKP